MGEAEKTHLFQQGMKGSVFSIIRAKIGFSFEKPN